MNLFSYFAIGIFLIQAGNSLTYIAKNERQFNDEMDVNCDPQIADSCFSDVQDDIRLILDSTNDYFQTKNTSLLRDLCSAWNDSLSCTSDIIDGDCGETDGRKKFDRWNTVLRTTLQHVCTEEMRVLRDVFHSLRCFNISAFFDCVEKTANLKNVQDLMSVDLDVDECKYINMVVTKCGEYVTSESCAWEVLEPVKGIFYTFFEAANCTDDGASFSNDNDISCDPKIADACFSDVQDDLHLIFEPVNNYDQAKNISLLRDLCGAWNDSLSCSSDIIDDVCMGTLGRLKFDHWNAVLRQTVEHVCEENMRVLQDLFASIHCFNISIFMTCVESTANLTNVQDLMATNLDDLECGFIRKVIRGCGEFVISHTCAQEVVAAMDGVFDIFFKAADCSNPSSRISHVQTEPYVNNQAAGEIPFLRCITCVIFIFFIPALINWSDDY